MSIHKHFSHTLSPHKIIESLTIQIPFTFSIHGEDITEKLEITITSEQDEYSKVKTFYENNEIKSLLTLGIIDSQLTKYLDKLILSKYKEDFV
ncbi:hypothetical protein KC678_02035 [Candidatus Dojkabacteria bacterium]|uniref:Uncharacterized protein n=1 Tax=Candidatus Dojkabacteria bacterium TaxID=2099670 RepID=A0A955L166_9BACT|nr:hypothetical protein [Candidatus Dojkabacteria bacterium]